MFSKSKAECEALAGALGHSRDYLESLVKSATLEGTLVIEVGEEYHRARWVSQALRRWLGRGSGWFLWLTEYGMWPSRENQHLMHRLRLSYGERGHYVDLPGHEFLPYQAADVESFLVLALLFGWGGYLFAVGGPGVAFFSHDGWVRVVLHDFIRPEVETDVAELVGGYELQ